MPRKSKNKELCNDCQFRKIDYTTSSTGGRLKHGLCRDCYERRVSKTGKGLGALLAMAKSRDKEKEEDVYETKSGYDRF